MPYNFSSVPPSLSQLASILVASSNNTMIYIYKDANGNITGSTDEQIIQTNNIGYPFNFVDGTQIYSLTPISSIQNIPWLYAYSTLPTSYDSQLLLWIDGKETRAFNNTSQKVMSKSYTTDLLFLDSSTSNKFNYSSNTIDLSNFAYLQSQNTTAFLTYWKLSIVFSFASFINNSYIFIHNNLKIKLVNTTAPDTTTQNMICLYDNTTFINGLVVNPTNNFIYNLYCDSTGALLISSNTGAYSISPTFGNATTNIYIGCDSSNGNTSNIKLYELLYYQGSSAVSITSSQLNTYLNTRWSLSSYTATNNAFPISESWSLLFSSADTYWNVYTYKPNATTISTLSNGFTLGGGGYRLTWTTSARASEMGIPLGITNPINVSNAKTNGSKYYVEFWVQFNSNSSANTGIGFMDILTSRMDIDYQVQGNNGGHFTMDRMWGNNWNGSYALYTSLGGGQGISANSGSQTIPDMTQANLRVGMALDYTNSSAVTYTINYNGSGGYTINTSSIGSCPIPLNGALLVPCIYQYGSNGGTCFIEYITQNNATYKPVGYTYIT